MALQLPTVSVVLLAYNHELYLRQALDSVLTQQTTFACEIIVGEDCSTDATRAIVREYAARYPGRLQPLYQPHNVGMGLNFKACLARCRGRYIALLEGDDYWTSPHKLQRQVTWLEQHPDFTLCFHPVLDLHPDGTLVPPSPGKFSQDVYEFADMLRPIYTIVSTGSLMLRNVLPAWPEWLFTVKPIDFALVLLYAEHGRAKLLPEAMSVYRIHAGGIWSGAARHLNLKSFLLMYEQLGRHYARSPHAPRLRRHLYDLCLTTANVYANLGYSAGASGFLGRAVRLGPPLSRQAVQSLVGAGLRLARSLARPRQPQQQQLHTTRPPVSAQP